MKKKLHQTREALAVPLKRGPSETLFSNPPEDPKRRKGPSLRPESDPVGPMPGKKAGDRGLHSCVVHVLTCSVVYMGYWGSWPVLILGAHFRPGLTAFLLRHPKL